MHKIGISGAEANCPVFRVMFSICSLSFEQLIGVYIKVGNSSVWSTSNRVWSTRFSFHRLLQFIKATDNFPDREEEGFLLRLYRLSAGLLGAVFDFSSTTSNLFTFFNL